MGENTGGDKVSHELELLQMQHDNGQSLFSCAEWAVYSDVVAPLGGGDMTIQVEDTKGDWHILRRKITKTWVIKVDADAVFFPYKLARVLQGAQVPEEGLY